MSDDAEVGRAEDCAYLVNRGIAITDHRAKQDNFGMPRFHRERCGGRQRAVAVRAWFVLAIRLAVVCFAAYHSDNLREVNAAESRSKLAASLRVFHAPSQPPA